MSLLTRRAVVLAKIEGTYNIDATPSPLTDAILVEAPDFMGDFTILARDYARVDLSPLPNATGRKLAKLTFTTELRGNGKQNSGNSADAPIITRLFAASGYALTSNAAASPSAVFEVGDDVNPVSWTTSGALTNTDVIAYYITCTTAGASAAAKVTVTSDTVGESAVAATITSGTAMAIGTKGLSLNPTFTGSLQLGQSWVVWLYPPGSVLAPVSSNFSSLTLYCYMDGTLHAMTGSMGTFSIDAVSGQYAKVKWEFHGQYVPTSDVAMPTNAVYERTLPPQVQLARLNVNNFQATVNAMTFTQANTIQPRPDINGTDGYSGVRLTSRKPQGGIDPEATLVASNDFWGQMSAAQRMPFQMRVGNAAGNTVWMLAPCTQYDKLTYKDRSGLRVYDAGLHFGRVYGNDEVAFLFV